MLFRESCPLCRLLALGLAGACLVASCQNERESLTDPRNDNPEMVISDAPRGGRVGFYFLPPMVPSPKASGIPTGLFLDQARVDVCDLGTDVPDARSSCTDKPIVAVFTRATGTAGSRLGYDPSAGLYQVDWNTDLSVGGDIKTDHYYRVQVWLGGPVLLGYADLDPVKNGSEMRNPTTGTIIMLVSGRTLPIKFRLEAGVATPLGQGGGRVTAAGGAVDLAFPQGALTADVGVLISPAPIGTYPSDGSAVPGTLYEFQPSPITFAKPVELTLAFPAALPVGAKPGLFALCRMSAESCVPVRNSTVNAAAHTVSGSVAGFSIYGITQLPTAGHLAIMPVGSEEDPMDWLSGSRPNGIWSAGPADVWAVNYRVGLMRFDGVEWQPASQQLPSGRTATSIWGSGSDNIYVTAVVDADYQAPGTRGEIYRLSAGTATSVLAIPEYPSEVFGTGPSDVWVTATGGSLYHYDGTSWVLVDTGTAHDLAHVWARSSSDVYVGTCEGEILHFDGSSWQSLDLPFGSYECSTRFWGTSDGYLFVPAWTMYRFDGSTWTTLTPPVEVNFRAVWATSLVNLYAFGFVDGVVGGALFHFDGQSWTTLSYQESLIEYYGDRVDSGSWRTLFRQNDLDLLTGSAANEIFVAFNTFGAVLRSVP